MDRLLLTILLVVLCVLAAAGLWWGWRNRGARQERSLALPELPAVPAHLGTARTEALTGLYVSSTTAGHWQDRVVTRGLGERARATVTLFDAGLVIDRDGPAPIFLPLASVKSVGTAPGIAGKVMGMPDGILVITWTLGGVDLDSGVRADDPAAQSDWLTAARELIEVKS